MFYPLLKWYARLAIKIYCRKIIVNDPSVFDRTGPLLLAANHPNSFLDGMILTTLFRHPVYALARGDVFKNRKVNRLLRNLQLLPVYRTKEGVENLGHNYTTFESCRETFQQGGTVLIFSEGSCENEWHLRPLKKGTARLAISSWERNIPVEVIPTAINYSSFFRFGKAVHLFFGKPVDQSLVMQQSNEGRMMLAFNEQLNQELKRYVYEIGPDENHLRKKIFQIGIQPSFYFLLLPALTGWLLHAPLFYACKLVSEQFRGTGHYDAALHALLLLLYPLYMILVVLAAMQFMGYFSLGFFLLLPLFAWCSVSVKYQADL